MVNATTAGLIGVYLLVRHGDRTEYYQNPLTYNGTQSKMTPLGAVQEYELGSFLRTKYLDSSSDTFISGISTDSVNIDQFDVRADSGGGNVVLNSAYALLQGLYPPSTSSAMVLANGESVTAPFEGYQYVPVSSVEPALVPALTSWQTCPYFEDHLTRVYASELFVQKANESAAFFSVIKDYLDGRSNTLENIWNVYDYINVQSIHNSSYSIPQTLKEQAQDLANFAAYNTFTDSAQNAIGEIAIRTLWPTIFTAFGNMTKPGASLKVALTEVDYKPFISLFNVTNATLGNPSIAGIANYASVIALELSEGADGTPAVSLKFKNGTADADFQQLTMFGNTSIPLPEFKDQLAWTTVNTTQEWCRSCNQTLLRGCGAYNYSDDPFIGGVE